MRNSQSVKNHFLSSMLSILIFSLSILSQRTFAMDGSFYYNLGSDGSGGGMPWPQHPGGNPGGSGSLGPGGSQYPQGNSPEEARRREEAQRIQREKEKEEEEIRQMKERYAEERRKDDEALPGMQELLKKTAVNLKKLKKTDENNTSEKITERIKARKAQMQAQAQSVSETVCFPAETLITIPVMTSQGSEYHRLPISQIQVGDFVVSCNLTEGGGVCEIGKVIRVFQRTAQNLVRFTVGGQTIRSTENHSFYEPDLKQWIRAQDLTVGQKLLSIHGDFLPIEANMNQEGKFQVFNLEVQGTHNYFACDVLVHNCNVVAGVAANGAAEVLEGIAGMSIGAPVIYPGPKTIEGVRKEIRRFTGESSSIGNSLREATKTAEEASGIAMSVGHYPDAEQMGKLLGVSKSKFHKKLKKIIISQHSEELSKNGFNDNPDVGYNKKTNKITFKDRITGKEFQSDTSVDSYKDE